MGLITPMALAHALYTIRMRSRNKPSDVFSSDDFDSGLYTPFITVYKPRIIAVF